MTTSATIGRLKALKREVLKDGKVDWEETGRLLEFFRPLAAKDDYLFQDFERLLMKCRADGKITREESSRLALHLESLSNYLVSRRLKSWLIAAVVLLLAIASFVLCERLLVTAGSAAARTPPPSEI